MKGIKEGNERTERERNERFKRKSIIYICHENNTKRRCFIIYQNDIIFIHVFRVLLFKTEPNPKNSFFFLISKPELKFVFGYFGSDFQNGSWVTRVMHTLAASTMTDKFMNCFEDAIHGLWLQDFIEGFRSVNSITKLLKIYCGNTIVVLFSRNDKYSRCAKYM